MEGTLDNTPRQTVMFFVTFIDHADIHTHTYSAIDRPIGEHGLIKSALIIHTALTQPEHRILVRWKGLETQ